MQKPSKIDRALDLISKPQHVEAHALNTLQLSKYFMGSQLQHRGFLQCSLSWGIAKLDKVGKPYLRRVEPWKTKTARCTLL